MDEVENHTSAAAVNPESALASAIAAARKQVGLTQQELCQKTGISYSTLAKIERGAIKSPSVFTVAQIAAVTGTTVEALVGQTSASGQSATAPRCARAKNGVELVLFDVNGCLVHSYQAAFSRLAADTGVSADLVENTFWHFNDEVCRGVMSLATFNAELASRLGVDRVDWEAYYLDAIEPVPEAQDVLRWAADQNFRVGLFTNIMPGTLDKMIERGIIPKLNYAAIVDSSVVKAIKPEEKMYLAAMEMTDVPAHSILLIDDSRYNLVPAEQFGWRVMWFDDVRPAESAERVRAALEI